jgi:hypothetical protein
MPDMIDYLEALDRSFEEAIQLLKVCQGCDLIYGANYYAGFGIGQTVFGVTITEETNVADLVDAFIKIHAA